MTREDKHIKRSVGEYARSKRKFKEGTRRMTMKEETSAELANVFQPTITVSGAHLLINDDSLEKIKQQMLDAGWIVTDKEDGSWEARLP